MMSNNKKDLKPDTAAAGDKKQAFKEGNMDNTGKLKTNNTGFIPDDPKNTPAADPTAKNKGK
jgi:hypothetical protein